MNKSIFISYAWADSGIINEIDEHFIKNGIKLIRDVRELNYRASIKEFMKRTRTSDFVLMFISENYLKSQNCMYEITEFIKDENYSSRILPILSKDLNIFNELEILKYVRYWNDKYDEMLCSINKFDLAQINIDNLKVIDSIKSNIYEFLSLIKDMSCIIVKNNISEKDFAKLLCAVGVSENQTNPL